MAFAEVLGSQALVYAALLCEGLAGELDHQHCVDIPHLAEAQADAQEQGPADQRLSTMDLHEQ